VQYIVCPAVVEGEKKDRIHDQNGSEPNRYVSSKDIRDRQNASPLVDEVAGPLRLSQAGGFPLFV
jgi:hypothetical protein